ncbi:FAD-binding monooxygenase, partial [Ilyonectria sp. MPI-CAGE-AT-0026]
VLIIGGGPIGLLSSILLAKYGIPSTIVEKHMERLGQPKACAINPRSLEILRQLGIATANLRSQGASPDDANLVRFAVTVAGAQLGSIPFERQDEAVLESTPEPLFNVPQPILEDMLKVLALKTGLVLLFKPWKWESCVQEEDGQISSSLTNLTTGMTSTIRSKYLLGCDGSHARSREQLSVPFDTLEGHFPEPIHYVTVHLKANFSELPNGILWFVMNDRTIEVFICYDRKDNWVFVMNYDPAVTPASEFTEAYCRQRLDKALGRQLPYEVRGITTWYTHPRIAQQYRSSTIRNAYLAGDAAHSFPSTGGLGINTGIADAHNLAWKINAAEKGWASMDEFLDTYTEERRPVAIANARQSALNQTKIGRLAEALFHGNEDIESRLSNPDSRKEIKEAIEDNRDHFDSLNLQIGYVYGSDPTRNCSDFVPECLPGARLPHAWIE